MMFETEIIENISHGLNVSITLLCNIGSSNRSRTFFIIIYFRSSNIREVLIFANFSKKTNSQKARKKYFSNSTTKEK